MTVQNKEEAWHIEKKIKKDKIKSQRDNTSWKKNLKHYAARKHRRMERRAIQSEHHDNLHERSYLQAEDRWSWD